MNDQNPDQNLEVSLSPQDTPPQAIEQEVVLPVAEVGEVVPPKRSPLKAKVSKPKQKRVPPAVSKVFLSEEDVRLMKRMNKKMADKFGINKNASFKV